jgi:hypothetical protein
VESVNEVPDVPDLAKKLAEIAIWGKDGEK